MIKECVECGRDFDTTLQGNDEDEACQACIDGRNSGYCQCCTCEAIFEQDKLVPDGYGSHCPECGSGAWVYGFIDS